MIKVNTQSTISELGKRTNNEDNFGLIKGTTFIVCDGVGGSDKGEVASDITVRTFIDSFQKDPNADAEEVLKIAESNLTAYINLHEEVDGMATTLTFSQIRENGIYVAWVGDSRIYQFRDGNIVFQTKDHSWVNEAINSGILTEEEAVDHPKSHVITRAVQGTHKSTNADTRLLTDIKKGDLILHCSDGVLESWTNTDLSALFASIKDPDQILANIKSECGNNSKDNFTAIVYRIDDVLLSDKKITNNNTETVDAIPLNENELNAIGQSNNKKRTSLLGVLKVKILGVPLAFFLALLVCAYIIYGYINNHKTELNFNYDSPSSEEKRVREKPKESEKPAKNEKVEEELNKKMQKTEDKNSKPKDEPKKNQEQLKLQKSNEKPNTT